MSKTMNDATTVYFCCCARSGGENCVGVNVAHRILEAPYPRQ